jgi:hypothetical protein
MNKNKEIDETDMKIKMMQKVWNKNRDNDRQVRKKRKLSEDKLRNAKRAQKA